MKKLRNFLIVMLGVFCLTGCSMKFEANMTLTDEGKLDFTIVNAYDKELIKNLMSVGNANAEAPIVPPATDQTPPATNPPAGTNTDTPPAATPPAGLPTAVDEPTVESMKAYLAANSDEDISYTAIGFTKADYEKEEFLGYQFTASIPNIDTVSSTEDVTYNLSKSLEGTTPLLEQKMFKKEGAVYSATFVYNAEENIDSNVKDEGNQDYTQYLSQTLMDFKYIITLPQAPIENNATTISEDGKTLTWNLATTGITNINFKFELPKAETAATGFLNLDDKMMMYIGIGLIVLILIIAIVIISVSKKKRKNLIPLEEPVMTVDSALNAVPSPEETVITPAVEMPAESVSQNMFETPVINPSQAVEENVEMNVVSDVEKTPIIDLTTTPAVEPLVMETPEIVTQTFDGFSNAEELSSTPLETQHVQTPPIFQEPINLNQTPQTQGPIEEINTTPVVEQAPVFETPSLDSAPVFEIPTDNNK